MNEKPKTPVWVIVILILVVCCICLVLVLVGGVFAYSFVNERAQSPISDIMESLEPATTAQPLPTLFFVPNLDPADPALTGEQVLQDTYLYDDFSSDALGWPVANDEKAILQYENGQYSFQVLEADTTDWSYPPIDFLATDIWFDVQGLPGEQNGTFGVFCQDQDIDNYYFAEFDLELRSYVVGVVINDEFTYLTAEDTDGNHWVDSNAINSKPEQVNRIGVSCYLNYITLFINDEWVDDFDVPTPFETNGDMSLYVYAFDFADENGYKVFFDNVEIY